MGDRGGKEKDQMPWNPLLSPLDIFDIFSMFLNFDSIALHSEKQPTISPTI